MPASRCLRTVPGFPRLFRNGSAPSDFRFFDSTPASARNRTIANPDATRPCQALTRFDQEGARAPWPNWGRFDAHVWLGQALAARGDKAGARSEYEKALAIAPGSNWVKLSLLPQVR